MLSYGYLPRGDRQVFSARMVELRNACVAKAHELGMGIVAMKVGGGGVLGAWSGYVVPGFDKERLQQLPAAAIRYVLDDERIHLLVIGMRLKKEVDANIKTLARDVTYTLDDRTLLAGFSAEALDSDPIKAMRMDSAESVCGLPRSSPYLTRRKEYRWPRPAKCGCTLSSRCIAGQEESEVK